MTTASPASPPPLAPEAAQFDFWLGEWDVAWGDGLCGTNRITKTLGDRVVLEDFDAARDAGLRGMSVSVYDATAGRWHQTWVDDNGSYFDFVGGWDEGDDASGGGRMVLVHARQIEGRPALLRMVWRDIQPDRLTWEWQRSDDDGATWRTLWQLAYTRQPAAAG